MPTTDSNGIIRYLDTDGAPTPPVLNLGMQSVSDALTRRAGRPIYYVADITARAAYVASETAAGRPPTATSPIYVHRGDGGARRNVEYTLNGTVWYTLPAEQSSTFTPATGYGNFEGAPTYSVIGRQVLLSGGVIRTAGSAAIPAFTPFGFVVVPAEIRPAISKRLGVAASYGGPVTARYNAGDNQIQFEYSVAATIGQNVWWGSLNGLSWVL